MLPLFFDYIEDHERHHFEPDSDCDFLEFKAKIKEEWEAYLSEKPWLIPTDSEVDS